MSIPSVAILILAAGNSSRMGTSKQLLKIGDKTLLQLAIETALQISERVVVVLGSEPEKHQEVVENFSVAVQINTNWKSGMGSSIKSGVKCIFEYPSQTAAILIMVCDQPAVDVGHLRKLVQAYVDSGKPIVASSYKETLGVPVLFDKSMLSELMMVDDSQGAKSILKNKRGDIQEVPLPNGEVDLDTPEAYEEYLRQLK